MYDNVAIENKWREDWEKSGIYKADKEDFSKPKYYTLGMWPYPSGNAHMGHVRVYTLTDIVARYKRMKGYNVINPIGWDAFGLPAENAAKKHNVDPREWTNHNIAKMRDTQLNILGISFDWDTEINTSDPDYYKWTQWIFIQMFNHGLVEKREALCNWCPDCETVLANEQVIGGRCWRCDSLVVQKEMNQWFVKITDYAEELYDTLDALEGWPQIAVNVQREWIGKKRGSVIDFDVIGKAFPISVFSTRPDTLFGTSCVVVSFDHPDIAKFTNDRNRAVVEKFCEASRQHTDKQIMMNEDISGFKLDIEVEHPFTKEKLPVYVGDYVLAAFGTGSVMCVPAHDKRDHRFAKKYGLPIRAVVMPADERQFDFDVEAFTDEGIIDNSIHFSGLSSQEAMDKVTEELDTMGKGKSRTFFRLKDWCISRQRSWGAPIPLRKDDKGEWESLPIEELPFKPEDAKENYETDTMDTFMCSSWYFYRFIDVKNSEALANKKALDYWLPVDHYVGAIEHAAQHLIYARFLCKFLNDIGVLSVREPVKNYLVNGFVKNEGKKMSKSKGNEVVPTAIVEEFGADSLRMFILGDSPPGFDTDWSDAGIAGKRLFLDKIYALFIKMPRAVWKASDSDVVRDHILYAEANSFIANITNAMEKSHAFNNVVSEIHSYFNILHKEIGGMSDNELVARSGLIRYCLLRLIVGACPVIPFITEELWREFFDSKISIHSQQWPAVDWQVLAARNVNIAIQVNGKLVDVLSVPPKRDKDEILAIVKENMKVQKKIDLRKIFKEIYVPDRIVNLVVR